MSINYAGKAKSSREHAFAWILSIKFVMLVKLYIHMGAKNYELGFPFSQLCDAVIMCCMVKNQSDLKYQFLDYANSFSLSIIGKIISPLLL